MNRQGIQGMKNLLKYLFSHLHNQFTQRERLKSERERGKKSDRVRGKRMGEKEIKRVRKKEVKKVTEKEIKQ